MKRGVHEEWRLSHKYKIALKTKSFEKLCQTIRAALCNQSDSRTAQPQNILEDLLSPNEEVVNASLIHLINKPGLHKSVSSYFSKTLNSFHVCALLLKSAHRARLTFMAFQNVLDATHSTVDLQFTDEEFHDIGAELQLLSEMENPFMQGPHFKGICESLKDLLQELQLRRQTLAKKLKWVCFAQKLFPELVKENSQLEAAAKGTYILLNQLETTRMLVARLYDEKEHNRDVIKIWQARKGEVYPLQQVIRLLGQNDRNYRSRLDEIEEQGCLCLMEINRKMGVAYLPSSLPFPTVHSLNILQRTSFQYRIG